MIRRCANRLATASRFFLPWLALLGVSIAYGHGADTAHKPKVRAILDALPAALAGLHIELRHTLAPQLLVANPTAKPLIIEAPHGRAFLRIGPNNVRADLGAAAFHRSNTLMAAAAIPANASTQPNWRVVQDTPNWGWFDLRLRTDNASVAHAVVDAGKPATVGHWSIPVRYGGHSSAIRGHFEYVPPARGIPEARVVDTGKLGDSALVRALTGSRRPGLFLAYRGDRPLTVLGVQHEPLLRFAAGGVQVNRHSVTWGKIAPAGAPTYQRAKPDAKPGWALVSKSHSYAWIEPRAAYHGPVDHSDQQTLLKRWRIPVLIGATPTRIKGVTEWQPVTPLARAD